MKVLLICSECGKKYSKLIEPRNKNFWREKEREEKPYGNCYECWQAKRLKDKEKLGGEARAYATEANLPSLVGTEKQIVWAETLRYKRIKHVEAHLDELRERLERKLEQNGNDKVTIPDLGVTEKISIDEAIEIIFNAFDRLLCAQNSSKFFIETRDVYTATFLERITEYIEEKEEKEIEIDIRAEATITPNNKARSGTAEIIVKDDKLIALYKKDDDFRMIVKKMGFSWDGAWKKRISVMTGSPQDRAAGIICELLKEGFEVTCLDNEARSKALSGSYEPEHLRWVYRRIIDDKPYFAIKHERNDAVFEKAKAIPGSKYNEGRYVPAKYFAEVEDFASMYDFKITPNAEEIIRQAKEQVKKKVIINADDVVIKKQEYRDEELSKILKSDTSVLDDLVEED